MHAKMTRDRKKSFIANIEETIEQLESNNSSMKAVLKDVVQAHFAQSNNVAPSGGLPPGVTPNASPALASANQSNHAMMPSLLAVPRIAALPLKAATASAIAAALSQPPPPRVVSHSVLGGADTAPPPTVGSLPLAKRICHGFCSLPSPSTAGSAASTESVWG